ncbi:parB/RepB/Spo0J family partition domain protein, partial [Escherichia coli P0304816.9]
MSVTEFKVKTERKSSRKPAKTQETALSALLAQTEEVSVPLASLIKSPLNVRTVPYSAESVSELAESIKGVGLLQNLVVHALSGERYGVAAGGRRLAALNMLAERGIIPADWSVRVKIIPQELATAASMTENGHRRDMHPAEQIAGFRAMVQEGKTPAQIGDLLGYSPRHVQRMLKLADLAPVILDALAGDRITTEHCQVLALENDTARQVQVFEAACQSGWGGKPDVRVIRVWLRKVKWRWRGTVNSALWGLMPSRQMNCAPICSAMTGVVMWTVWRSMPLCWKNSRLSLNTFGKPKAGNGAPDAWSLSVSAVRMPEHTAVCR